MEALTNKHGNIQAKEYYKMICPLVQASIGQHIRHCMDHIELAVNLIPPPLPTTKEEKDKEPSSSLIIPEVHYDLRQRGGPDEYDMDEAEQRIQRVSTLLQQFDNNNSHSNNNNNNIDHQQQQVEEQPVQAHFMLSGDIDTEYGLTSSIGRELGFAAHHAIHHLALVKLIATQTAGLKDTDLPDGFGRAPSTIRFDKKQQ